VAAPSTPLAALLAALSYGERLARERAERVVDMAPNDGARKHQQHVAERERENEALVEARVKEIGSLDLQKPFKPFFDEFFERTEPSDWLEAQAFHYVGDAMVTDFAEVLQPILDPVSAEVIRRTLVDRDEQEAFALDELTRGIEEDPGSRDRVAAYARRVIGEALNQTRSALNAAEAVRGLLGGPDGEKAMLLELLGRHRVRFDRLGIEPVE
jgi:hypothetical protein